MGIAASVNWVMSVCSHLRRSQAKTLSRTVAAALSVDRISLGNLGRSMSFQTRVAAKHCTKRVDRFVGNARVEPCVAMRGVISWLAVSNRRLLVSLDWVDVGAFHCLVLAARIKGRAIPLLWAVYQHWDLFRSQNNYEYGLLRVFRAMLPESSRVVILADRGFGRTEMGRVCQELKFHYIIRIDPGVWISHEKFTGNLLDLPVSPGCRKFFRGACYRKKGAVRQNVAVLWVSGRQAPWFLMTDLDRIKPDKLAKIYGGRMTIEQYFRDTKSRRNGFALRLNLIKAPRRLERLLLVLALAYIVLVAVGLQAARFYQPKYWCSNNRPEECSLFTIGRYMLKRPVARLRAALSLLRNQLLQGNWG